MILQMQNQATGSAATSSQDARNEPPKIGGVFWFRAYHDDVDDRRLAIVAARAKVPRATAVGILHVLKTHASRAADRGLRHRGMRSA